MLIIHSASSAGVRYWQKEAVSSLWLGHGAHSLGLEGPVSGPDLADVLGGRAPGGPPLTPRPGLRRRQGWDLVLAAPKSFSLLAEGAERLSLPQAPALTGAFGDAVSDTIAALEERVAFVASGGQRRPAPGVVAASFQHVASEAGQPHFHSHVVLANLGRLANPPPGRSEWGCLVGNELWRWREALSAGFHMALRDHLARAGLRFTWQLWAGGLGEIAEVPTHAREAASTRSHQVAEASAAFGSLSRAASRVAQGQSRQAGGRGPVAGPALSDAEVTAVLDRAGTAALTIPRLPGTGRRAGARGPEGDVAEALAGRASTFAEPDVLVALSETVPDGALSLPAATALARQWYQYQPGHGGKGPTTARAAVADERVVDLVVEGRFARRAAVSPWLAERELAELGAGPSAAAAAISLTCGGEAVSLVPRAPFLDQAEVVDAARSVWQAAGITVALVTPNDVGSRRWHALTSLLPPGPGHGRGSTERARTLVVDAADHLSPVALERLVGQAAGTNTKLVLVAGGSVPGSDRPLAQALDRLAAEHLPPALAAMATASAGARWAGPGAATSLRPAWPHTMVSQPGSMVHGALSGPQALAHLLQRWANARQASPAVGGLVPVSSAPLMVAFGPAEAEALNAAAKQLTRAGPPFYHEPWAGPASERGDVLLGSRWYGPGDEVMALRRLGQAPPATRGVVVGTAGGTVSVNWHRGSEQWTASVGPSEAASMGHGYATTLPYLRGADVGVKLFLLGAPGHLGLRQGQCQEAWLTLAGSGQPSFGPVGREARRTMGLAELEPYLTLKEINRGPLPPPRERPRGPSLSP